jgi:hypothetical protein
MEKTTTKTIVKAKQQLLHHGGSKSAAAEVITVENPEALSCPKCLHPLKPPVFQVLDMYFKWISFCLTLQNIQIRSILSII